MTVSRLSISTISVAEKARHRSTGSRSWGTAKLPSTAGQILTCCRYSDLSFTLLFADGGGGSASLPLIRELSASLVFAGWWIVEIERRDRCSQS